MRLKHIKVNNTRFFRIDVPGYTWFALNVTESNGNSQTGNFTLTVQTQEGIPISNSAGNSPLPNRYTLFLGGFELTPIEYSINPGIFALRPVSWTFEASTTGAFSGEQDILDIKTGQNLTGLSIYTL